jgi:uncharacterized membrane protein
MDETIQNNNIHKVFIVSLILKGLNSLLEIVGGIFFLFTGSVASIVNYLIKGELIEDPTDFVATHIQHVLPYFSSHSQLYASFYLFTHGIIKLVLVICLLRKKLWAYPATIAALFLFIGYQLYKLYFAYSLTLTLLTIFDIVIIILTWHEYKAMKKHLGKTILS